jgi:hypothetical protein
MMPTAITLFAKSCAGGSFFGFPKWYKYLPGTIDPNSGLCSPQLNSLSSIWLIAAAIIEIMLRVAAIVAVIFVIYGGFAYVTSQGEPESTGRAKSTIVNALVGLAVAVSAAAIVTFIASSIS